MGRPKSALEWHGSTLLQRTAGILRRAVGGPVVVVRAPGQELPDLPTAVEVVADDAEGLGPLQGIASGLAAVGGRAPYAFVASTDLPFLHPEFVRRVLRETREDLDVVLPVARGYSQPLAAAYGAAMGSRAAELVAAGMLRPVMLAEAARVLRLDDAALLADPALAAADPELDSLLNVNRPDEYDDARSRPAPAVTVVAGGSGRAVAAATLAAAVAAAGIDLAAVRTVLLNEVPVAPDPALPLVDGDVVTLQSCS
jgi:molybdopterin-guanine dinucleotide biosynthesis protein A